MSADTPSVFVRVSTEAGHFTVPAAIAERAGSDWTVLKGDAVDRDGRPLPDKPRTDIASTKKARKRAPKLRSATAAATPTPTESDASDDTSEESE